MFLIFSHMYCSSKYIRWKDVWIRFVCQLTSVFDTYAGYLACARCSSTGTLVLTEPVSTVDGGNQPLSLPKTERCSNCSGAGKVRHIIMAVELNVYCLLNSSSCLPLRSTIFTSLVTDTCICRASERHFGRKIIDLEMKFKINLVAKF